MTRIKESKNILNILKKNQRSWAERSNILIDENGYCKNREDNFFQPLSSCTIIDLMAGDGAELGNENHQGKIQAVHSSSALACNFFDYWRRKT